MLHLVDQRMSGALIAPAGFGKTTLIRALRERLPDPTRQAGRGAPRDRAGSGESPRVLRTGALDFVADGEVYLTGRSPEVAELQGACNDARWPAMLGEWATVHLLRDAACTEAAMRAHALATACLLVTGCHRFGGLYEVVEHTLQADCDGQIGPFADGPAFLLLEQEKRGLSNSVDAFFCAAADDCSDEEAFDYGVSWGVRGSPDGWSRSGSYSSGTCSVDTHETELRTDGDGIRLQLTRREGTFDGAELLGLSRSVTSGSEESRACSDAVEAEPELIPCRSIEVLRGLLVE